MAQRQDKIVSWNDVYDEINRVINLPATGAATTFDGTNVLSIEDVQVGNTIDDTDVEQLIERYEALKNDALYGNATQLNTSHVVSTVNLYNTTLDPVEDQTLIEAFTDTNAKSIKYNISRIQCRNVVYCTNSYYSPCHRRYEYCYEREYNYCTYDCYNNCSYNCVDGYCGKYGYSTCSQTCYSHVVHNYGPCYDTATYGDPCYRQCGTNITGSYHCGSFTTCNNYSYHCSCDTNYYCNGQCSSAACSGRCASAGYGCNRCAYDSCSECWSQSVETPCSRGTHNDILCSNTYWAGN